MTDLARDLSIQVAPSAGQKISLEGFIRRMWQTLVLWRRRAKQRSELARLPGYILKDLGLNEVDRERESRKPFWRP